jgi:hypothetical protein
MTVCGGGKNLSRLLSSFVYDHLFLYGAFTADFIFPESGLFLKKNATLLRCTTRLTSHASVEDGHRHHSVGFDQLTRT